MFKLARKTKPLRHASISTIFVFLAWSVLNAQSQTVNVKPEEQPEEQEEQYDSPSAFFRLTIIGTGIWFASDSLEEAIKTELVHGTQTTGWENARLLLWWAPDEFLAQSQRPVEIYKLKPKAGSIYAQLEQPRLRVQEPSKGQAASSGQPRLKPEPPRREPAMPVSLQKLNFKDGQLEDFLILPIPAVEEGSIGNCLRFFPAVLYPQKFMDPETDGLFDESPMDYKPEYSLRSRAESILQLLWKDEWYAKVRDILNEEKDLNLVSGCIKGELSVATTQTALEKSYPALEKESSTLWEKTNERLWMLSLKKHLDLTSVDDPPREVQKVTITHLSDDDCSEGGEGPAPGTDSGGGLSEEQYLSPAGVRGTVGSGLDRSKYRWEGCPDFSPFFEFWKKKRQFTESEGTLTVLRVHGDRQECFKVRFVLSGNAGAPPSSGSPNQNAATSN